MPDIGRIKTEIGDNYFKELAFSNLNFPAALCELIDNAISSTSKKTRCTFNIDIFIIPTSDKRLQITVTDDGAGIARRDIEDGVFRPAGRTRSRESCYRGLREHGFGLKQALAWLIKETGFNFELRTAFVPASTNKPEYTKVVGPLQKNMIWQTSSKAEWNEWAGPRGPNKETGTRIRFWTTMTQAKSGWVESFQIPPERMTSVKDFVDFLSEQLGVTYRHFLKKRKQKKAQNTIRIVFQEFTSRKRKSRFVAPVEIPYLPGRERSTYKIKKHGKTLSATYIRGISDEKKVENNKIFYKHDPRAQGLDVVLHGKIIESAFYIWPGVRHDSYNGLVGELFIKSDAVATILTKNRLDWESPLLTELREKIIMDDIGNLKSPKTLYNRLRDRSYPPPTKPPPQYKPSIRLTETQLKDFLADLLRGAVASLGISPSAKVIREDKAWSEKTTGCLDIPCDITYEDKRGFFIFECKLGDAEPLDLYQILMYWDGFAEQRKPEESPLRAFLVADHIPPGVTFLRNYLRQRNDKHGTPYEIKFRTWATFGLYRDRFPSRQAQLKAQHFVQNIDTCK